MFFQISIDKNGYQNVLSGEKAPISGRVDKKTQRVAWKISSNNTVLETSLQNLTQVVANCLTQNFLTATWLSLGVPMISMGDEIRRTQGGNNNAFCQDNETSWFVTARRLLRGTEHELQRMSLNRLLREANKAWHGVRLNQPDLNSLKLIGIVYALRLNSRHATCSAPSLRLV
jgi:hypothetical protein